MAGLAWKFKTTGLAWLLRGPQAAHMFVTRDLRQSYAVEPKSAPHKVKLRGELHVRGGGILSRF